MFLVLELGTFFQYERARVILCLFGYLLSHSLGSLGGSEEMLRVLGQINSMWCVGYPRRCILICVGLLVVWGQRVLGGLLLDGLGGAMR